MIELFTELGKLGSQLLSMMGEQGALTEVRKIRDRYRNIPSKETEQSLDALANEEP